MSMLWKETSPGSAGAAVRFCVKDIVKDINRKAASRGRRAVEVMRAVEKQVLKGERSGKVYRKYPYKTTYRASAPGEAPAVRTGNLRMHWSGDVDVADNPDGGVTVDAVLESQEEYAYCLEKGKGMEPRPFVEKIKEKAEPEIRKIYNEPFT